MKIILGVLLIITTFIVATVHATANDWTKADAICDKAIVSAQTELDRDAEHKCSEWLEKLNADLDCTPDLSNCTLYKKDGKKY